MKCLRSKKRMNGSGYTTKGGVQGPLLMKQKKREKLLRNLHRWRKNFFFIQDESLEYDDATLMTHPISTVVYGYNGSSIKFDIPNHPVTSLCDPSGSSLINMKHGVYRFSSHGFTVTLVITFHIFFFLFHHPFHSQSRMLHFKIFF